MFSFELLDLLCGDKVKLIQRHSRWPICLLCFAYSRPKFWTYMSIVRVFNFRKTKGLPKTKFVKWLIWKQSSFTKVANRSGCLKNLVFVAPTSTYSTRRWVLLADFWWEGPNGHGLPPPVPSVLHCYCTHHATQNSFLSCLPTVDKSVWTWMPCVTYTRVMVQGWWFYICSQSFPCPICKIQRDGEAEWCRHFSHLIFPHT